MDFKSALKAIDFIRDPKKPFWKRCLASIFILFAALSGVFGVWILLAGNSGSSNQRTVTQTTNVNDSPGASVLQIGGDVMLGQSSLALMVKVRVAVEGDENLPPDHQRPILFPPRTIELTTRSGKVLMYGVDNVDFIPSGAGEAFVLNYFISSPGAGPLRDLTPVSLTSVALSMPDGDSYRNIKPKDVVLSLLMNGQEQWSRKFSVSGSPTSTSDLVIPALLF